MAKDKKKAQALPEGEETAEPKKKSRKKLIIILVVLLFMLTGVGAGVYWWFFMRSPGTIGLWGGGGETATTEAGEKAGQDEAGGSADDAARKESAGESAEAGSGSGNVRIERPAGMPRRGVVVPLPPITVNLGDAGGRRYLKLGMEVEANKDITKELKGNEARIRDAVIMLLAGKTYSEVASPDGKIMLKAEVANRLNQILGAQRIVRIYFTDFVVQ